jgi:hypothetical protein
MPGAIIGIGCCWLIGYRARRTDWLAFLVVLIALSVCLFLVADSAVRAAVPFT